MASSAQAPYLDELGTLRMEGILDKKRTTKWPAIWQERVFTLTGKDLVWAKKSNPTEKLGLADMSTLQWRAGGETDPAQVLHFDAVEVSKQRTRVFMLRGGALHTWREAIDRVRAPPPALKVMRAALEADADPAIIGTEVRLRIEASEPCRVTDVSFGDGAVAASVVPDGEAASAGGTPKHTAYVATAVLQEDDQKDVGPLKFSATVAPELPNAPSGDPRNAAVTVRACTAGAAAAPQVDCLRPRVAAATLRTDSPNAAMCTAGTEVETQLTFSCAVTQPTVSLRATSGEGFQLAVSGSGDAWRGEGVVPDSLRGEQRLALQVEGFEDAARGTACAAPTPGAGPHAIMLDTTPPAVRALTVSCRQATENQGEMAEGEYTAGDTLVVELTADKPVLEPEVCIGDGARLESADTSGGELRSRWELLRVFEAGDADDGPIVPRVVGMVDGAGNRGGAREGSTSGDPVVFVNPAPYDGGYTGSTEEQVVAWLFDVLGEERAAVLLGTDQGAAAGALSSLLRDGIALCELVNALSLRAKDAAIAEQVTINYVGLPDPSAPAFSPAATRAATKLRENVGLFINKCKALGVQPMNLFRTEDLYDERDIKAVWRCVQALGRKAHRIKGYHGPCLGHSEAEHRTDFKHNVAHVGEGLWGKAGGNHTPGLNGVAAGYESQLKERDRRGSHGQFENGLTTHFN